MFQSKSSIRARLDIAITPSSLSSAHFMILCNLRIKNPHFSRCSSELFFNFFYVNEKFFLYNFFFTFRTGTLSREKLKKIYKKSSMKISLVLISRLNFMKEWTRKPNSRKNISWVSFFFLLVFLLSPDESGKSVSRLSRTNCRSVFHN